MCLSVIPGVLRLISVDGTLARSSSFTAVTLTVNNSPLGKSKLACCPVAVVEKI